MRAKEFINEEVNPDIYHSEFKHELEIDGLRYTAETDNNSGYGNQLIIKVYDGNKEVANAEFYEEPHDKALISMNTWVISNYQGQNIATNMYAYAKMLGNDIMPSDTQTDQGERMWRSWNQSGQSKHILPKGQKGYRELDEDTGTFSKVMTHETSPEAAAIIMKTGFRPSRTGIFFNVAGTNYSGGGYGGTEIRAQITGPVDDILNLEDDNDLPDDLDDFADGEEIANYAREEGYWAWTDGVQFAVLDPRHIKVIQPVNEDSAPKTLYHVTPSRNVKSILQKGLVPSIGARSSQLETDSNLYFFPSKDAAEDAVVNWLGDEFPDDEPLALLAVSSNGLEGKFTPGAEYEYTVSTTVPPQNIKVLSTNI